MSEIASLSVTVGADISGFTKGMKDVESGMQNLSSKVTGGLDSISSKLIGTAGKLSLLTAPLAALGLVGVNTAMQFDSAMAEIAARTGATETELEAVRQKALQMGADTAFSAQDAATAFLELLASGQTLEEAMATIEPVMTAAAASGESLGVTADGITNVMAMFGLEAENASTVVDALARAAGASSADMASLIQGFNNGGAKAAGMGIDVQDTANILAIFAENGTKGAEAGTLLKSMLTGLNADKAKTTMAELGVSLYDAEGGTREFSTVLAELKTALDPLPAEQQNAIINDLAGSYGEAGLRALLGSISMGAMATKMEESTGAAEVAEAKMGTFAGQVDALAGSIETLNITVMTPFMNDVLKPIVGYLTEVVNAITKWAEENPELVKSLVLMGSALVVVTAGLFALGGVASFVSGGLTLITGAVSLASGAFTLLTGGMTLAGAAASILLSPLTLLLVSIGGLIAFLNDPGVIYGLQQWGVAFEQLGQIVQKLIDKLAQLLGLQANFSTFEGTFTSGNPNQSGGIPGAKTLPGFATGLDNVPFDGFPAILHKGEMVVPAKGAEALRNGVAQGVGAGGGGGVTNVFNINSYGRSPAELMELIKREARNAGR